MYLLYLQLSSHKHQITSIEINTLGLTCVINSTSNIKLKNSNCSNVNINHKIFRHYYYLLL